MRQPKVVSECERFQKRNSIALSISHISQVEQNSLNSATRTLSLISDLHVCAFVHDELNLQIFIFGLG